MIEKDPLNDAIDRAVREMTHVTANDRDEIAAVARVMARLREADAHKEDARGRRGFAPRLAWAGAAVFVLMAIVVTSYMLRSPAAPDAPAPRVAQRTPAPASSQPQQPRAMGETPTRAARAASTVHATTAVNERDARDEDLETSPPESDIAIANITPAPLDLPSVIRIEPLITSSLQVDEIPLPSIELLPAASERNE